MLKIVGWAYTQNVLGTAMSIQGNMTCSLSVQNERRPTALRPESWFGARPVDISYEESDRNLMTAVCVGSPDSKRNLCQSTGF